MLKKKHFRYRDIDALRAEIAELGLSIRLEEKIEKLLEPVRIGHKVAGNAFGIHPMEGCDGMLDGKPSELTIRRWERFGRGGAKLIWGEATALFDEVKSNSRQLVINDETASSMESILNLTRNAHREEFGPNEEIIVGMQLTHSGRYSYQKPLIAFRHPVVDKVTLIDKKNKIPIPDDYPILSDGYLERQEDIFVEAAKLAWKTGFDFVDLKQCHTYLLSELLAAKTREGKYGGSFENRTRFIRNIVGKIRAEVGDDLILATRLNVYDGVAYMEDPETTVGVPRDIPTPYLYGFGVDENSPPQPDMTEPIKLVGVLKELGVKLVNVTTGSPYFNPHIGRPFERPPIDGYETPEHPLIGVDRHIRLTGEIQGAYPDLPVVGTGYSWLQQYLVNAAEANVRDGRVSFVAVGRGALAYPDYARDTIEGGEMVKKKVCVAVSYCTALMRAKANPLGQFAAGCVPRDKIYAPIYKEAERTLTQRD